MGTGHLLQVSQNSIKSDFVSEIKLSGMKKMQVTAASKLKYYFKQPVKIEVFELYSPARIVVDIVDINTE